LKPGLLTSASIASEIISKAFFFLRPCEKHRQYGHLNRPIPPWLENSSSKSHNWVPAAFLRIARAVYSLISLCLGMTTIGVRHPTKRRGGHHAGVNLHFLNPEASE
jgi:hypothetical protein